MSFPLLRARRLPWTLVIRTGAVGAVLWSVAACGNSAPAAVLGAKPLTGSPPPQVGAAAGYIAEGESVSPFDDTLPAITRLEPRLRAALRQAAARARQDGVQLRVSSGWRAAAYQQLLLDRAVVRYGSLEQARRFVSTPRKSAHVRGAAVDVAPTDADSWLSQHGADYGLCQTYANEAWHFELATTPGGACPAQLPDASG